MAIKTDLLKAENLRIHTVTGSLSLEKLITALKNIYASDKVGTDINALWDIREADVSSFSHQDIVRVRDLVKKHWGVGGASRAAIVVTDLLDYGLSRMYGLLMESYTSSEVKVFKTKKEALEWLSG